MEGSVFYRVRMQTMGGLNKKLKIGLGTLGVVAALAATVAGAVWVTGTQSAKLGNARSRCEVGEHRAYKAVFDNDRVSPGHIDAKLCDKLTITHLDAGNRLVACRSGCWATARALLSLW
jgi:hypothetical protein